MSEIKLIVICTCAVLGPIPKTKEALFLVVHCAWKEQEKVFLLFSGWIADCRLFLSQICGSLFSAFAILKGQQGGVTVQKLQVY